MRKEKQIDRTIEYLNNAINVERNSYFGKGCITMPLIEADKILDILQGYRKQSENVIELPCKVGDTVYCIEHKTIHECLVTMVKSLTYENRTIFFVEAECEIVSPFYSDGRKIKHGLMAVWEIEWGSWYRAFRMREEAEQAIAKMKGGE